MKVNFAYSPPEWQAAICLPDDPHKTLVDHQGALLYHYESNRFGTQVHVEVTDDATWKRQTLVAPKLPIVQTVRAAAGLEIVEEAFAVTDLPQPKQEPRALNRVDNGRVLYQWARPTNAAEESLRDVVVGKEAVRYSLAVPPGQSRRIALVICEGSWERTGKRVQILEVEGAEAKTIDTVADIGKNRAAAFWFDASDVDRNGRIDVAVRAASEAADRYMILNGLWAFAPGTVADSESLLAGKLNDRALARRDVRNPGGPARNDLILVEVRNIGPAARTVHPRIVVETKHPLTFSLSDQRIVVNSHETVTTSLKMIGIARQERTRHEITLKPLPVAAGSRARFHVLFSGGGAIVIAPRTIEEAQTCRDRAVEYWRRAPLPMGRVQVPDAGIQALFDSSVRNIWQAREIKNGLPVFQVGPTCYRGLWIVDGAFLLEAATLVGAGAEARNGIAYTLTQQQDSGAFQVLSPHFYKENGIVLWTCARHARLTQDKAWLESVWPCLEKAAGYVQVLRKKSLENETPLDDGLNPPGEIDGGLSGQRTGFQRPEFSNVHWNLTGLRALIGAAHWLKKEQDAGRWQKEYDDLCSTFRRAAERGTRHDEQGNAYVPIFMANAGPELPQRAQWTFCHAVYPGQIFAKDDPLVASTLAMLRATEREGMVYGTGWDATGIWNYFASFYAHAWLWQGDGDKAARVLYAFANHASPTLAWREEQSLRGTPFRKVGDMPHNWASAEFIRLVIHLLALDRGDELHLFEGLPAAWADRGMATQLDRIATPFGPLSVRLNVSADGATARLKVEPLADPSCARVVVHLGRWAGGTKERVLDLDPKRAHDLTIRLGR